MSAASWWLPGFGALPKSRLRAPSAIRFAMSLALAAFFLSFSSCSGVIFGFAPGFMS